MRSLLLGALFLSACSEYEISDGVPVVGMDNQPPLPVQTRTDRIVQVTIPSVDVLWVIDNSCSMQDEQNSLTNNFPAFMDYFVGSGLDYHVGVVSTDMDDTSHNGKLRTASGDKWIDESTNNPTNAFTTMANMGTSGSGNEQGIGAGYAALELKRDTYNSGFLRDSAAMHAVVISDEEDHTNGDPVTVNEFIGYLQGLKSSPSMVTWSSIVNEPGCCSGFGDEAPGTKYIDVTNAVGGILWPITNNSWDSVLEQLGVQASGLKREFFLAQIPVPDSVQVWVEHEGVEYDFAEGVDFDYLQDRNSILFDTYVPDPLSVVYIEYELLAAAE